MTKKTPILVLIFTLMTLGTYAQQSYDYAIGLRAGNPLGATGKYYFTENHSGEAILGLEFNRGFNITALYEYNFYLSEGGNWYVGGGMSVGAQAAGATFGFDAIVGVEFTLPLLPINFGVDWKPAYVFGLTPRTDGLLNFAFSLRYAFR